MNGFLKRLKFLKNFDLFGRPITLTMKEDLSYKTIFGGLLAFFLKSFFSCIVLYSLYQLITEQNFESTLSTINLGISYGFLNLNEKSLNFALKFDDPEFNNWTRPYINVSFVHVTQFRNSSLTYKVKKYLESKPCEYSDFEGLDDEFDKLDLKNALCLRNGSNLTLQGNYQEDLFSYFQIILTNCTNESICQDQTKIYDAASKLGTYNFNYVIFVGFLSLFILLVF